ncbi:MAG TPA: hypothetical protein VEF55_01615 [Candidatus Binatia bacterium]|nr:hypothetical protein [Candidatus Binatia bacterium]
MKYAPIMAAALLLAACATIPTAAPPPEAGARFEGDLDLGGWRNADEAATLSTFQQNVTDRYGAGIAISDAAADLRRTEFNCADAPPQDQGRGDPPAQVCRRTITFSGCTHTWQVHLFDQDGDEQLVRTRGLYDRRCGNEGLLGGPG